MNNPNRITLKPHDIEVVEGPAFTAHSEDGPYTDWHIFVVYRPAAGDDPHPWGGARTWEREFSRREFGEASAWAARVRAHGSIHPDKWPLGDPWRGYHGGMTLEERWAVHGPEWQREDAERREGGH